LESIHAALDRQVDHLEMLTGDLLDVARIQHGQLMIRPAPIDLAALAAAVVERYQQAPERRPQHRLELVASEPIVGNWDGGRLEQVIGNLLSNALKYSPEGGTVRLAVGQEAGRAWLTVDDQGPGIAPAEQASLFEPFVRGRAAQGTKGLGLGLFIATQIAAQHGGNLSVASQPGQGSCFRLSLPLACPAGT
jgi:signal transduction histidine kinase